MLADRREDDKLSPQSCLANFDGIQQFDPGTVSRDFRRWLAKDQAHGARAGIRHAVRRYM